MAWHAPVYNLTLDSTSREALERISNKPAFGNALGSILSTGVLASIFIKSNPPQAAFNITQTDWNLYALSMKAVPRIRPRCGKRLKI